MTWVLRSGTARWRREWRRRLHACGATVRREGEHRELALIPPDGRGTRNASPTHAVLIDVRQGVLEEVGMMKTNADGLRREEFTTACGRRIRIGEFRVGTDAGSRSRVTLDVGPEPGGRSRAWAGLTPAEARELATLLLRQATRAETEGTAPGR
jgi:hypothetical protein